MQTMHVQCTYHLIHSSLVRRGTKQVDHLNLNMSKGILTYLDMHLVPDKTIKLDQVGLPPDVLPLIPQHAVTIQLSALPTSFGLSDSLSPGRHVKRLWDLCSRLSPPRCGIREFCPEDSPQPWNLSRSMFEIAKMMQNDAFNWYWYAAKSCKSNLISPTAHFWHDAEGRLISNQFKHRSVAGHMLNIPGLSLSCHFLSLSTCTATQISSCEFSDFSIPTHCETPWLYLATHHVRAQVFILIR